MALNANNAQSTAGKQADPIADGTYVGRLVRVVDLGVQRNAFDEEKRANEINITIELMDEYMDDDPEKPRVISDFVKLYRGATKGRNVDYLAAFDPSNKYGGDWGALCRDNVPVLVNIIQKKKDNGQVFNKINSLSPIMKGMNPREAIVDSYIFDLDAPDREVWEKLPEWIQTKISQRETDENPIPYERTESDAAESQTGESSATEQGANEGADEDAGDDDTPW